MFLCKILNNSIINRYKFECDTFQIKTHKKRINDLKSRDKHFCNIRCYHSYRNKNRKLFNKTCLACKNNFSTRINKRKYCSQICSNNSNKIKRHICNCIICNTTFFAVNTLKKACSDKCEKLHFKNKRKILKNKSSKEFFCKLCNKKYKRLYRGKGFCSHGCSRNWFLKNNKETFKKSNEKRKKERYQIKCSYNLCNNTISVLKRFIDKKINRYCSKICSGNAKSDFMKANPTCKFLSEETKRKIEKTTFKKYGVKNGYELAKHVTSSKPQLEIFNILKNKLNNNILKNHRVYLNNKFYIADIIVPDKNIIIEFNGSFWHCDPFIYSPNYFNKKKNLFSKEIWEYDAKKIHNLSKSGFKILIVWEDDFKMRKENTINRLIKSINCGKIL